jgi:hypothetical protein
MDIAVKAQLCKLACQAKMVCQPNTTANLEAQKGVLAALHG